MQILKSYLYLIFFLASGIAGAGVFDVSQWTSDSDCGISSGKEYTHAVNFSNGLTPTVNGITFTSANGLHSGDNWQYGGSVWFYGDNDTDNNITGSSADIAKGFEVSSPGTMTLTLSGLKADTIYELTLFSVTWDSSGERYITLEHKSSSYTFDQNTYGANNGIKATCIYRSDSDGTVSIVINGSYYDSDGRGLHFYGFTNCEYDGDLPVSILTVGPEEYTGGNRVSIDSAVVWEEEFSGALLNPQFDVYFDPNLQKLEQMDASTLAEPAFSGFEYAPALEYGTEYYWMVVPYVGGEPNTVYATPIRSFMTEYEVESWSYSPWTDDSDILVSVGKTYTHKVNFNASEGATTKINGVKFENDSNREGSNWILDGATWSASGSHQVVGDGGTLVSTMFYNQPATLTLTGLVPGKEYIYTEYTRGWGTNTRDVNLTTSVDGRTTLLKQNEAGNELGRLYKFLYTAPESGELDISYSALTSDTWHHYAFSNEVYMPVYVTPAILPGESVEASVVLEWTVAGETTGMTYNVTVASDESLANIIDQANNLEAAWYNPDLESDSSYYWQVEIVDNSTIVYSSPVWSFTTAPPVDAECVIEWKLDETDGIIAEQTGPTDDADGILMGFDNPASSHVPGLINNCLLLNGKDEYVDVSDAEPYMPTSDGNDFAVSGYLRTVFNYGPIFSMRNSDSENPVIDIAIGWDGAQNVSGRICLLVRDDDGSLSYVNSGITVNDGRWHNFAVTRVEGKWTLYVDGVSKAVINGAATGDVSLNLMGLGGSLRWFADKKYLDNTYFRHFRGMLDNIKVWDGQLQPHQIAEMAALVPPAGDIDMNMETAVSDVQEIGRDWLASSDVPVQDRFVLDDMESYDMTDPNSLAVNWPYTAEDGYGDLVLSVADVSDPNDPDVDKALKMDYDFSTGGMHAHIPVKLINRGAYVGKFDRIDITIMKAAGCELDRIVLDLYDGRDIPEPSADDLYEKGRLTIDIADVPENELTVVSAAIPGNDAELRGCSDLYQIMLSLQDGGADIGTIYVSDMALVDGTPDCIPALDLMNTDLNNDCIVDLADFVIVAQNWMAGVN